MKTSPPWLAVTLGLALVFGTGRAQNPFPRPTAPTTVTLALERSPTHLALVWPVATPPLTLELTDGLGAQARWWPAWHPPLLRENTHRHEELWTKGTRFYRLSEAVPERWISTTDGPRRADQVGVILPHEHLFTDLRAPTTPGHGQADAEEVVRVMKPFLDEVRAQGVGLFVEASSIGVGRNVNILARLAAESGLPIVVPTGVYGRDQYAPPAYRNMTEDDLTAWMIREIREGIEGTSVKAGFIKIATGGSTLTALEQKFLRSAGRAALETGAAIASHTTSGAAALRQMDILQAISPSIRFIWVHAQAESSSSYHRQMAARGAFIELDSVGSSSDTQLISIVRTLVNNGHTSRILLSHDAGWYQPGQPNGGTQRPFTYLLATFVPKLRTAGFGEDTIQALLRENPARAFGIPARP